MKQVCWDDGLGFLSDAGTLDAGGRLIDPHKGGETSFVLRLYSSSRILASS